MKRETILGAILTAALVLVGREVLDEVKYRALKHRYESKEQAEKEEAKTVSEE